MKVWKKVEFEESDETVNIIAKSLTNYLFSDDIVYSKLSDDVKSVVDYDMASKIAGILMLYYSNNKHRINDIVNKYNRNNHIRLSPIIEGYFEQKKEY